MSSLIVDVAKINAIEKHPNADRLRIATVKGWQCIIGLDDFNVGDLVVFIPPDSVLPDWLCDKYNLEFVKKGGRVKSVKLRGFISQGLCLPVPDRKYREGMNMAIILGITKYEPPRAHYQGAPRETLKSVFIKYKEGDITFRRYIAKSIGIIKDTFRKKKNTNPSFTKYTDIENIKNYNSVFKDGDDVVITEKIHGSNFRAGYLKRPTRYFWQRWVLKMLGEYEFVYGSHNVQLSFGRRKTWHGEDVYGKMAKKYKLAEVIPEDYIVYGEIYGPKIQELTYGMKEIDMVVFDVKYKDKYLNFIEALTFCEGRGLSMVPVHYMGPYSDDVLKGYTNCNSTLARRKNKVDQIAEGCVVKPQQEEMNPRMGRKILKSINAEYLITKNRTEHH